MTRSATGSVEVTGWDEHPYDTEAGRPKLARAAVRTTFQGGVTGSGTLEYLLAYHDDEKYADHVGLHRVVGELVGRTGSFVLQLTGTYGDGRVAEAWTIVPGTATGELTGLRGTGTIVWAGDTSEYTLDFELPEG